VGVLSRPHGPEAPQLGPLRAGLRLLRALMQVLAGLLTLALRFPRASAAQRHAHIRAWSRGMLNALGVRLQVQGDTARVAPGSLIVLNHVSWLDILCLHAALPQARFISKADVRRWPVLGWMVAAAGTLFIERTNKRDALRVVHVCAESLRQGDCVAVFPEGTTGEGPQLLPFHANLLQAAISVHAPLQPLALRFHAPGERFAAAAAYTGDTDLLTSAWRIVRCRALAAELQLLAPIATEGEERRSLAEHARGVVQAALDAGDAGTAPA
jgi:1-acyl-sn-glycerol-3-phosphate acyltransferase